MNDVCGKQISVGDYFVTARSGGYEGGFRFRVGRVISVEEKSLKVVWADSFGDDIWKIRGKCGPVTLTNIRCILIVPSSCLSLKIINLLADQ